MKGILVLWVALSEIQSYSVSADNVWPKIVLAPVNTNVTIHCISSTPANWFILRYAIKRRNLISMKNYTEGNNLVFSKVKLSDSNRYTCEGYSLSGRLFSESAEVLVGVLESKRIHPSIANADIGHRLTMFCKSHYAPRWFKRGHNNSLIDLKITKNELVINSSSLKDIGQYHCYGRKNGRERHFIATSLAKIYDPSRVSSSNVKAIEGETVYFYCITREQADWAFYTKNETTPSNMHRVNSTTLVVWNISKYNQGVYECEVNSYERFYAKTTLYVIVRNINIKPRYVQAYLEEKVYIYCESVIPVKWHFRDGDLPFNAMTKKHRKTYQLKIKSISFDNGGKYTCTGATTSYNFTSEAFVEVFAWPSYSQSGSNVYPRIVITVQRTEKVVVHCKSSSKAKWYRKRKHAMIRRKYTREQNTIDNYLVLKNLNKLGSTWYFCKGVNSGKNFFEGTEILVGAATIYEEKINPFLVRTEQGRRVKITCASFGLPRWFKVSADNSISEIHGNTYSLVFENITLEDNGDYNCYGTSSHEPKIFIATSTVKVYDNTKVSPQSKTVNEGETVNFRCDSEEETTWIFNNNKTPFPSNARVFNFLTLRIENVTASNQGTYECEGYSDAKFYAIAELYVIAVNDNLRPSHVVAFVGENITLISESLVDVKWYFDGKSNLPSNIETGNLKDEHWLMIKDINCDNIGTYTCYGATEHNQFKSNAYILVRQTDFTKCGGEYYS